MATYISGPVDIRKLILKDSNTRVLLSFIVGTLRNMSRIRNSRLFFTNARFFPITHNNQYRKYKTVFRLHQTLKKKTPLIFDISGVNVTFY